MKQKILLIIQKIQLIIGIILAKKTIVKSPSKNNSTEKSLPPINRYVFLGLGLLVVFLGGFLLWASTSQLESAAMAGGQIIAETKNKSIEHLEGGIIKQIYVKDGQQIKKGQILIQLDRTKAQASFDVLNKQHASLLAEQARLIAERDNQKTIDWPNEITQEKRLQLIHQRILKANNQAMQGKLAILNKQIEQLKNEIKSYQSQVTSETKQLKFIRQEVKIFEHLEKKKLIELPKLLELKRKSAKLLGNQGQYIGLIAKTEQKIGETKQKIITIKDNHLKEVLDKLKEVRDSLADLRPKLQAATDTLARTSINAPNDGVVMGLTQFTHGGVISPGETVMTIFPSNDKLIAEANVNPADIELIRVGLTARVTISALKQRNTPSLTGKISHISADVFKNDKKNQLFYKALIIIPDNEIKKLKNVKLYPGMQLQVMIVTDKRTPLDYFITPIIDSFRYAFREQ